MLEAHRHLTIRPAAGADAGSIAKTFAASWQQAYTGIVPYANLARTIARRDEAWWATALRSGNYLALDVLGENAGYAGFGKARHGNSPEGEIFELYLAPLYQGLGFGEYLFEACRATLDDAGMKGLMVWVLEANDPAREFYWRRGGRLRYRRIDLSTGSPLNALGYVWD